jgi:hypothetical protein
LNLSVTLFHYLKENKEKSMNDLTQLLTDPTLCSQLQTLDLTKFVGVAGAPAIEQGVQYLKEQWALPTKLAPVAAIGLGVVLNVGLSLWLGLSLVDAVGLGAATGLLASGWHLVRS